MHAAASYLQNPGGGYPSFLSYAAQRNPHYPTGVNAIPSPSYNGYDLSSYTNNFKQSQSDDDDEDDDDQPSDGSVLSLKKRSRTVPSEQKDATYYEKRARNNDSAKRSRDARRVKEQHVQGRVSYLEHEHSRLLMENQAIRYQLSQLHALCGAKP
jgi:hypothetical protein